MRVLFHLGVASLFACLFVLAMMMVQGREAWALRLSRIPVANSHLCNVFLYVGRIFEAAAIIGAFLETVAVIILASGSLVDFVFGG